jgi:dienelactone hydrolase
VDAETITYTLDGDDYDVVVAHPKDPGPHPAVLICHAWGGRDKFMEEKARELARMGYVGAAIDVYGVGKRGQGKESSSALMMPLIDNPALLRARLSKAHEVVSGLETVDSERMAAIGYCFGGACSILCARMGLPLRGVVSFHGLLKVGEQLDADVRAQILVLHGQDDPMVPPSDVAAFAEEMKRINADWQLHAYPGVMHAFTNPKANDPDFGTVYDESTDRRSWAEMKRFLGDVL